MKIVSDCFNFVTTILSYHIKFKNCLSHRNGAKISVLGDIQQEYTNQRLKAFEKFIKTLAQNFQKFSKIFQK